MSGFFETQLSGIFVGASLSLLGTLVASFLTRASARRQENVTRETARLSAHLSANVKLAEFRQAWLGDLRDELADMTSMAVAGDLISGPTKEYSRSATRVELLMNPKDPNYVPLKEAMARFLGIDGDDNRCAANDQFVAVRQTILKSEWDVLKEEVRSVVDFRNSAL